MIIRLGEFDYELRASFYTLYVYEQEFGSDLIQDVFGVVRFVEDEDVESDSEELVFDYTATAWTCIMKAAWSMVKTCDELAPSFELWSKGISGVNMVEIANKIIPEIRREFFR